MKEMFDRKDIQIMTFSSGNDWGCRIHHIPTGLFAECNEFRSQHKNVEKALDELRKKVEEFYEKRK